MRLGPGQRLAVRTLARRMGCDSREAERRLISVALFALGMDYSAESDLTALAVAAGGEEDYAVPFNFIVDSNAESWSPASDLTRAEGDAARPRP